MTEKSALQMEFDSLPEPCGLNNYWYKLTFDGNLPLLECNGEEMLIQRMRKGLRGQLGFHGRFGTSQSVIALWILSNNVPETMAERYHVNLREFLFHEGWEKTEKTFGSIWLMSWLRAQIYIVDNPNAFVIDVIDKPEKS